jgi:hypothetical protein
MHNCAHVLFRIEDMHFYMENNVTVDITGDCYCLGILVGQGGTESFVI